MSWEDEFAWGNNEGENSLDVIPPVVYTPFKCEKCGHIRTTTEGECGNLIVIEQEEEIREKNETAPGYNINQLEKTPTRIEYNCQCVIN
tara:strand:- start:270 stop:536 length:267 start_codon:yes stop_codon:yes gene_type:complete